MEKTTDIPEQVAHALKCKNPQLQFTGHILSLPDSDEYAMVYECLCGFYEYEIKSGLEVNNYSYPTDNELNDPNLITKFKHWKRSRYNKSYTKRET